MVDFAFPYMIQSVRDLYQKVDALTAEAAAKKEAAQQGKEQNKTRKTEEKMFERKKGRKTLSFLFKKSRKGFSRSFPFLLSFFNNFLFFLYLTFLISFSKVFHLVQLLDHKECFFHLEWQLQDSHKVHHFKEVQFLLDLYRNQFLVGFSQEDLLLSQEVSNHQIGEVFNKAKSDIYQKKQLK